MSVCVSAVYLLPLYNSVLHYEKVHTAFYRVFSVFDEWIFEKNVPSQSYGVIYLTYSDSYPSITESHNSSFDGISFAGCLKASGTKSYLECLSESQVSTEVSFRISPDHSWARPWHHRAKRVQTSYVCARIHMYNNNCMVRGPIRYVMRTRNSAIRQFFTSILYYYCIYYAEGFTL